MNEDKENNTSKTGKNRKPGTFLPGDKRINRTGRPKTFTKLRELALEVGLEKINLRTKEGKIVKEITVIESILLSWSRSSNPICQKNFLEICFGKVPDELNIGLPKNTALAIKFDSGE
jgi:hypothetical protein